MIMTNKIQKLKSKSKLGQLAAGGSRRVGVITPSSGVQPISSNTNPSSQAAPSAQPVVASNQTYNTFNLAEDVVNNVKETVTAGLWSDNLGSLTTCFTASDQSI
jgi:hypothetical protein